jgi:DNA-binding MarR family transcriptional regulator
MTTAQRSTEPAEPSGQDLDEVAARLRAAVARCDRLLVRRAGSAGLTRTQHSVLGTVVRDGAQRLAALAAHDGLHATMLSRVVGALEQEGLVTRVADPTDARQVVVGATASGRRVYRRSQRERAELVAAHLRRLPPDQARCLSEALPLLEALADELAGGGAA